MIRRLTSLFKKSDLKTPESKIIDNNMKNVVNSIFLCAPLYDELKIKCHPDKFLDEQKKITANNFFQEIQQNKYDYEKLLALKIAHPLLYQ
ncbi:MAG: hypothetical protein AB7S72_18215 [Draconibacterium sp.]